MDLFTVALESHAYGGTLYLCGLLHEAAASRAHQLVYLTHPATRVIRVDMRGVDFIDPTAFVTLARTLNRWRERTGGDVRIEFPRRSARSAASPLALPVQPRTIGIAVSTAMACPMSTSPG